MSDRGACANDPAVNPSWYMDSSIVCPKPAAMSKSRPMSSNAGVAAVDVNEDTRV